MPSPTHRVRATLIGALVAGAALVAAIAALTPNPAGASSTSPGLHRESSGGTADERPATARIRPDVRHRIAP